MQAVTESPEPRRWEREIALRKQKYTREQRKANIVAALLILKKLERDDEQLEQRAAAARPDGLKSANYDASRGSDVSDPTGQAALQRIQNNPRDAATRALSFAMEACRYLELADSERARALPPAPKPADNTVDWCSNCQQHGVLEPRGDVKAVGRDSPLCTWCHAFLRQNQLLPPRPLVMKHASGERIYTKDVTVALMDAVQALQEKKSG